MHIIIDLLGAQLEFKKHNTDTYLSDIMDWVNNNNIDKYYFILHSNINDSMDFLKEKIEHKEKTKTFFYFTETPSKSNNKINSELYLKFIKTLKPKYILVDKKTINSAIYSRIKKHKKLVVEPFNKSSINILEKTSKQKHKRTLPKLSKLKLAFVSPLPPEKTGIASYSKELAESLKAHYDIVFITDQKNTDIEWINKNCSVQSTQWLLDNSKKVDRVLYHIGNSSFHAEMFETIKKLSGVVVLHDFFLGDALWYIENFNIFPNALNRALYKSHGYFAVKDNLSRTDSKYAIQKHPVNFEILSNATGTIFHSDFAIKLIQDWYPNKEFPITQIPHLREIKKPNKPDSLNEL